MRNYEEKYRDLTAKEREMLEINKCSCENWDLVQVAEDFDPNRCSSVHFSGEIKLCRFDREIELPGGVRKKTGIYNAHLHHCSIGENVLIENVTQYIANYNIGAYSIICNLDRMVVSAENTFGNGVRVSVLNETGGREVTLTEKLTAHTAYLSAFYRHDVELVERLEHLSQRFISLKKSSMGEIGCHVEIRSCHTIENVNIGDYTRIIGASRLYNGSILSNESAPVFVGYNVICSDFILHSGSSVKDGTTMSHCFLGQGSHLSHLFSAHDSLFFSNCQGENGEACAVFAGPYTVSMHKSSLLIAGYYSFLNAGSGSNQSNHLYKLGPIHQGIVERGSKTTSDSYILWPSHIGPFSLVMGRHVHHIDSSAFPFSYLIEDHNETFLFPGVNLRSVGTIRDAKKWPARDKRLDTCKSDCINFNLLSPYTVGKMLEGYRILNTLKKLLCNTDNQKVVYKNMHIRNQSLEKGMKYYHMAIVKFLGNSLIQKLKDCPCNTDEEIINHLKPASERGLGDWLDLCGLIAPKKEIAFIIEQVKSGAIEDIDQLNKCFRELHTHYYELEWPWAYERLKEWFGLTDNMFTKDKVCSIIKQWEECVVELDRMLYDDARKEFTMSARVGFGIDLNGGDKEIDFENVRGAFETNPFVLEVLDHIERKRALGESMRTKLGC